MNYITRPRDVVLGRMREAQSQFFGDGEDNGLSHSQINSTTINSSIPMESYPLVVIHLRTGWSDEMQRQSSAWEALDCGDEEQLPIDMVPHAINSINLEAILLDTAHYSDEIFGPGRWRLYFASDAPGLRRYVHHVLSSRAAGIAWNTGPIGHNSLGGSLVDERRGEDLRRDMAVSAMSDLIIMSEADLLVSLPSRFPGAAKLRSMCPYQRTVDVPGMPREALSMSGLVLALARGMYGNLGADTLPGVLNVTAAEVEANFGHSRNVTHRSTANNGTHWSPRLTDAMAKRFFSFLRGKGENPCTLSEDPVRSCFCMLKLSHQ